MTLLQRTLSGVRHWTVRTSEPPSEQDIAMTFEEFAAMVRKKDAEYRKDTLARLEAAQAAWMRYVAAMHRIDLQPLSGEEISHWQRDIEAMPKPSLRQIRTAYMVHELEAAG